jgi:hypothetical protein
MIGITSDSTKKDTWKSSNNGNNNLSINSFPWDNNKGHKSSISKGNMHKKPDSNKYKENRNIKGKDKKGLELYKKWKNIKNMFKNISNLKLLRKNKLILKLLNHLKRSP